MTEESPIAKELREAEKHQIVTEGHNPDFKQPAAEDFHIEPDGTPVPMDPEKTEFTPEEIRDIQRRARAQAAADAHFADKKIIGIATKLLGLHYDTAINQAEMLQHHVDGAIRKVKEAVEAEGMEMIEDISIQIRVSVMVQPKEDS